MSAPDVLEVVAIFGSIVAVWFALVGWTLVSLNRWTQDSRLRSDE
jgi:hypothetical protein